MSEILSQEEIETLLASLPEPTDTGAPENAPSSIMSLPSAAPSPTWTGPGVQARQRSTTMAYEIYDFRRPDKFSKDQLKSLQMLHETFTRSCASALAAYLRAQVHLELSSLEQVPYEEYLRPIDRSVFVVFSMPPLHGQAVLEMEFSLVFSMLDRLLGGPGKSIPRSNLTEIERPLVERIFENVFTALKSAWEGLLPLNPTQESMETSSAFVQIAPPGDIVVTILFEVKVGDQRGAFSLCIPYVTLKGITPKLSAQKWFGPTAGKASIVNRRQMARHVHRAIVPCTAQLGRAQLNIREFLDLRVGNTLQLDQETGEELTMLINHKPKFRGKPAISGKKLVFAVSSTIED